MFKTIEPAEMKRVENRVMDNTSITGEALMQLAAAHVAHAAQKYAADGVVLCLCGTGNNGGDGMAAMRILAEENASFRGECWVLPGRLSADAVRELERLAQTNVVIRQIDEMLPPVPETVSCAIDALFGTGLCRPLEGLALEACRLLNQLDAPVLAVDIPSGLSGLSGDVLGEAVRADVTVTFHRPKPGLYLKNGPDFAGEIVIGDIGIPESWDDADGFSMLEKADLSLFLPKRKRVSHKGSYGRVLLWAGSRGMAGAAAIAAQAALRTGAGLVTVACPDRIVDVVQTLCPCATCLPLPECVEEAWPLLQEALEKTDALGAGCGLGRSAWAADMLERVVKWLANHSLPAVLDADGLNLLGTRTLRALNLYITPHPAEAARLLGCTVQDVLADAPEAAKRLHQQLHASVVLKGTCSVLCTKEMGLNPYGTPAMAKGGSGDALTGILAALLAGRKAGAYAMNDLQLLQTGCALHGLAGELAAERFGERGVLATDLCACLGLAGNENPNIPLKKEKENSVLTRRKVTVVVEHPAGSKDDEQRRLRYQRNCGYVQQVLQEQNEWQDACILEAVRPMEWYEGEVCAVARISGREVWCVGCEGQQPDEAYIRQETAFLGEAERIWVLA